MIPSSPFGPSYAIRIGMDIATALLVACALLLVSGVALIDTGRRPARQT